MNDLQLRSYREEKVYNMVTTVFFEHFDPLWLHKADGGGGGGNRIEFVSTMTVRQTLSALFAHPFVLS